MFTYYRLSPHLGETQLFDSCPLQSVQYLILSIWVKKHEHGDIRNMKPDETALAHIVGEENRQLIS